MRYFYLIILFHIIIGTSCSPSENTSQNQILKPVFQNQAHELVYNSVQKIGTYEALKTLKDVEYTYTYTTPDGKEDRSIERYIFDGELSYGKYIKHERTLADREGIIKQGYDGISYWCSIAGKLTDEEDIINRTTFNRPTNFYWFAMFPKLLDPGLLYEYKGNRRIDGKEYDIVNVTFEPHGKKAIDTYQVFINKETLLIDQFLFTVADYGVMDNPLLMKVEYNKINNIYIPSIRKYKRSSWEAEVTDKPWTHVTWTEIKFNNGFTKKDFMKP